MNKCVNCGADVTGLKFCSECGTKVEKPEPVSNPDTTNELLWSGSQHIMFGLNEKLKVKATDNIELKMHESRYEITQFSVRFINEGTFNSKEDNYNFREIADATVNQSFMLKAQGLGDVVINLLNGKSATMKAIKDPKHVRNLIMDKVHEFSKEQNVFYRKDI